MKTAISLPDSLFQEAEAVARRLKVSRSELYAKAIASFLESRRDADITQRLNDVYAQHEATVDPALNDAQLRSVGEETW